MAARRRCSPWPGRSGAVERAQTTLRASSPHYRPSAPKNERKEAGYSKIRHGAAGALGFELGALVRLAASGGACSGNGARRNCCCCASGGRRKRRGRQNGGRVLGARVGVPTRGWRWPAAARPTPAYGRHVAGAGWSEAGAARAGERGGGAGRVVQLGRKGGGSAQQRLSPFLF